MYMNSSNLSYEFPVNTAGWEKGSEFVDLQV